MKIHTLRRTQFLPIPMQQAWDYFSEPANLRELTPPKLDMRSEPAERPTYAGQLIVHNIQALPFLRRTWVTEITHVESGRMFIDQQLFGPYRMWHHRHLFTPKDGGTEMLDEIHYSIPFPPFGDWFLSRFIRSELESLFDYRCKVLEEKFKTA